MMKVEQLGTKEVKTKFGMKPTYSFKADGAWFSCGFKNPKLNVGDEVEFAFNSTSYGNEVDMGSLKIAKGTAPASPASVAPIKPAAQPSGGKGVFPIPPLDGQRSIVRQNALTNARELYQAFMIHNAVMGETPITTPFDMVARELIGLARKLEAYTTGDMDMEEVKKEMAEEQKAA